MNLWYSVTLIKDTLNKGHLITRNTFLAPLWKFIMLNDPSTKDKYAGPNGVHYRGVPLYIQYYTELFIMYVLVVYSQAVH